MKRQILSVAALILLLGVQRLTSQTVSRDSVITGISQAYGVSATLSGFMVQGSLANHSRGENAFMARSVEGARSLRVAIHYPAAAEMRVVDGDRGWQGAGPGELSELEGLRLAATLAQGVRAAIPWFLDELRDSLTVVSADSESIAVSVAVSEGVAVEVVIATDGYRIVETTSRVSAGPMTVSFKVEYSDFRMVEGVLFPFHEETYAQGVHTATLTVESVVINPPDAGDTFFRAES